MPIDQMSGVARTTPFSPTLSVRRTGARRLYQAVDLFISKASHFAGFTRDADRHLIGWSILPGATEVEQLINVMLKIEGHLPPRRVVLGELAHPGAAHTHVGDLIGQDHIYRPLDDRIAEFLGELHQLRNAVTGQSFQPAVAPRHTRRRVFGTGTLPENARLRIFSQRALHMPQQSLIDFRVA